MLFIKEAPKGGDVIVVEDAVRGPLVFVPVLQCKSIRGSKCGSAVTSLRRRVRKALHPLPPARRDAGRGQVPQIRQPLEQQMYRVQRYAVAVREVQALERLRVLGEREEGDVGELVHAHEAEAADLEAGELEDGEVGEVAADCMWGRAGQHLPGPRKLALTRDVDASGGRVSAR